MIFKQVVAAANDNRNGISVLFDNIDVFLLLRYHYPAQNVSISCYNPVKGKKTLDILGDSARKQGDYSRFDICLCCLRL